jgi:hypothetical protein
VRNVARESASSAGTPGRARGVRDQGPGARALPGLVVAGAGGGGGARKSEARD